jgi:hypothetical protein
MPLYVISVVPKELDIDEVLHEVIVRPTLQLEAGRMFGQQLMAGTIHLIAGNNYNALLSSSLQGIMLVSGTSAARTA